jgi:hypothetical protein
MVCTVSKQTKRKNWFFTALGVLASTGLAIALINPASSQAGVSWHRVGNGNLDVMKQADGSYLLYPAPTTYVPGVKGSQGKEFKLGTKAAYKLIQNGDSFTPQAVTMKDAKVTVGKRQAELVQAAGHSFVTNKEKTHRLKSGEVIMETEDSSNLIAVSDDGSTSRALLNNDGYDALLAKVIAKNEGKGEDKQYLVWATNAHAMLDGEKVVFSSNKNTIEHGTDDYSVFVVDADGSNEKVLIDSEQYGAVGIIGTTGNLVVAHNIERRSVITADVVTGEIKEYVINGWPQVLAANGNNLMFRPLVGDYIQQNDLRVLNLTTGAISQVTGMPAGYFYNTGGEWSPDGTRFAFYANGLQNKNEAKMYRDNNLLVMFDTTTLKIQTIGTPPGNRSLYPLGALHWVGDNQLLTYADDDSAWLVDLK